MLGSICRVALCAAGFMWLSVGHAQTRTTDVLTLSETVRRVTESNPSLAAFTPRLRALQGERSRAALAPPLEFSADANEFAGSNEASGLEGVELTLALSSVIELGGKPAARSAVIGARGELLEAQRRSAALDALARAARLYVQLAAMQQELVVARQALELSQDAERTVSRRAQRGRAPDAEVQRAKAAAARARLEVGHLEHQIPGARVRLAALWGESEPDFTRVDDDALFHPGSSGDFATLVADLEQNPDLLQLAGQERIEAANLRLAQSSARGDVRWRAGVRRLEGSDSTGLVAGISIPLFSGRRAQGDINAAQNRHAAAQLDRSAALIAARATLFEAWQHRSHAIEAFSLLREAVIPRLESALTDTRSAYNAGRYSYLELIAARRELIQARLALVDAASRAHLNRIELERLAGAPLRDTLLEAAPSAKEFDHDH